VQLTRDADGVVRPVCANRASFRDAIDLAVARYAAEPIDGEQ
jgi:hypothetical protein